MSQAPVVGIGASAGGLESLQRFFRAVASDSGLSYIVVQHLSASFKSMMDALLRRCTTLPIDIVRDGMVIEPDHIYLNPPARLVRLVDDRLELAEYDDEETLHLPIDELFESLSVRGPRAAAVVLSGTGSDGARGLRLVHDEGGLVIAESRATASFGGMPRSAVETGVVAAVLAPEEMPPVLRERLGHGSVTLHKSIDPVDDVLRMLRARYDIDFSLYRRGTLGRRLKRRRELSGAVDMRTYADRLASDKDELQTVLSDLLIGVTTFFRDPECFERLGELIAPRLETMDELRIWSAGCASGQEAYSLAMLASELVDASKRSISVKVFATDVHARALEYATAGHYTAAELDGVNVSRRERFFERTTGGYRVVSELRRMVIFAQHDLLHDAPFTGIDVVVCRNMLIYLGEVGQKRALSYMRFAMKQEGLLLLGPSETTHLGPTFEPLDEALRVFEARSKPKTPAVPATLRIARPQVAPAKTETTLLAAYDALCDRYMPPGFLVDDQRQLVDSFAGAERFLGISGRRPSSDVLELLKTNNRGALMSGLRRVEAGEHVKIPQVEVGEGDDAVVVDIRLEKIDSSGRRSYVLITLGEPMPYRPAGEVEIKPPAAGSAEMVADLEHDLRETRVQLNQTVEELEAANEELQASNEEMTASNEELQATNEELSSVNEELYSVNAEYQATNAKLHESNSALEQLFTATQIVTIFVDQAMTIRRIVPSPNPVVTANDDDIGRRLDSFQHDLQWPEFYDSIRGLFEDSEPLVRRVRSLDGTRTWFIKAHRYDVGPGSFGVVITCTDVTTLVRAERRAKTFQKRLTETTNALPILLSYVNEDEVYEFVNDAYVRRWEKPREQIVGSTVQDVLGAGYAGAQEGVRRALRGERVEFAMETPGPDGMRTFDLVSYTPAISDGEVRGFYAAVTDITERRETELALEIARASADSAARAKSEFLANMSHEVRTPMTAILGYADLIASETAEAATAKHAETIRRNGRHLIGVIDDVLDLSRIEHRGAEPELVKASPGEIAADVHGLFGIRARRKGLEFRLKVGERLPAQVETHPQSVRQILFNLLSNAIKFTSSGFVSLGMRVEPRPDGQAEWVTTVSDSGVGFPADMASKLFEPFEQLDSSHTRTYHGTGLGLAISLRLAKTLGGRLSAHGEEGRGATFELRLPLGRMDDLEMVAPVLTERSVELAELVALEGELLVVDDAEDVRLLIRDILMRAGAHVTTVSSGAKALALIDEGFQFDAVVLDIQMPEIDGLEVARRMRSGGFERPILAVTARALPGDDAACLEAGCSDYLAKPVDAGVLTRRLAALLGMGKGDKPPSDPTRRLLVVEDNEDAAELLVALLETQGMVASHVGTVAEALREYQRVGPDTVLCDLKLPDGTGSDVAEFVRSRGDHKTQLIAISGRHDGDAVAQRAGFDAFLLKPVSTETLLEKLRSAGRETGENAPPRP